MALLIHCVGETLSRQPSALGPPHCRPPREEGGGSRDRAPLLRPARPLGLASPFPTPECGRDLRAGLSRLGPERALRPLLRAPLPGRALGGSAWPLLSSPSLPPSIPAWRAPAPPPAYCGDSARAAATGAGAAAAGPAAGSRARGVLGRGSASRSASGPAPSGVHAAPPTRGRGAPLSPRARAAGGRAPGARACGKREVEMGAEGTELSQAPGPPDRAKWGVMAAGAKAALPLRAAAAAAAGELILDARVGVCVYLLWCARRVEGDGTGCDRSLEQWSCPLLGDFPQPPLGRAPCPPPASRPRAASGGFFPAGRGSVDGVAPGGAGRRSSASHTVCFVCFSLPRSRFPLCGGRRDHKGLTHIFNPLQKVSGPCGVPLRLPPPSPSASSV